MATPTASPTHVPDLSTDAVSHILASCTHVDWTRCACVCRLFREVVRDLRASCSSVSAQALGLVTGPGPLASRWAHAPDLFRALLGCLPNLRELRLPCTPITDQDLEIVSNLLPKLAVLDLSECQAVTNRGVRCLMAGCPLMEELIVTYCELIGYSAMLVARHRWPRLRILRRQPEWMDGSFVTPWGETHTYYADGGAPTATFPNEYTAKLVHRLQRAPSPEMGLVP